MEYLLIAFGVLAVVLYVWYAKIISKRNTALEALSGIDVQLKKRSDLIPNILKIAKRFMEHEQGLLTDVTELRTRAAADYDRKDPAAVSEHLAVAEALSQRMGSLMVQVEAYPDLKSDTTMVTAMQSYNEVEANISAARRFYNSAVASLNTAIQIFPGNVLAGVAGVAAMPYYEADEASRAPVDASDHL